MTVPRCLWANRTSIAIAPEAGTSGVVPSRSSPTRAQDLARETPHEVLLPIQLVRRERRDHEEVERLAGRQQQYDECDGTRAPWGGPRPAADPVPVHERRGRHGRGEHVDLVAVEPS